MSGDDLERIYSEVLEAPPEERGELLERLCGGDPALRERVQRLISSSDAAFEWFDGVAERVGEDIASLPPTGQPDRVGPYRLLEPIGSGGMGDVFRAERIEEYEQRVAIKLVRRTISRPDAVARFVRERGILARLEHPNIARLLDGGVTEDRRPYLVMELVEGTPLVEHCRTGRLSLHDRLELMERICDAVHYAHQNLIVHRDLKPSNILVTTEGVPKLLDFGIAKFLDETRPGNDEALTRTGVLPLTPEYASPEQFTGGAVTTATDTYALGVLLYELLAGQRPFDFTGKAITQIQSLVLESTPAPPSRAERPPVAARRLAGDLDRICAMALRKEPERRYRTAAALAEDLRRHREGRPVSARPDTVWYRTRKFVARNRLAVSAAAISGLALVVAGVSAAQSSVQAQRERDKAQRVAELMVEMFEATDPAVARGREVSARELLDRAAERLETSEGEDPLVRASLQMAIGRAYKSLGLYEPARPFLEQALESRQTHPVTDAELLESLAHAGDVNRLAGDYGAALPLLEEALHLAERVHGRPSVEVGERLHALGLLALSRGDLDNAEEQLESALEQQVDESVERADTLATLGGLHLERGNLEPAEKRLAESLAVRRAVLGDDHPQVAAGLVNLGSLQARAGRYAQAITSFDEAMGLQRRLYPKGHPSLATTLNNLALATAASGDLDTARTHHTEALELRRALLPPDHPELAQSAANLGMLLQQRGELDAAEPLHREALKIRTAALGPGHVHVAQSQNNLAMLLQARGEGSEAIGLFRAALETLRGELGGEHPLVASNLNNLADALHANGSSSEAEALHREALAIRRKVLPPKHPHLAYSLTGLGEVLLARAEPGSEEACALLVEAASIRDEVLPEGHPERVRTREALGRCPGQAGE